MHGWINTRTTVFHQDTGHAFTVTKYWNIDHTSYRGVFDRIINQIKNNAISFDEGDSIIKFCKNLERIGDHAKNIAEDVIFLESGSDIRHNPEYKIGKKDS